MADLRQRYHSFSDAQTSSRRLSGSEAIRKRVAELLHSTTRPTTTIDEPVTINRAEPHHPTSPRSSSRDACQCHKPLHELRDDGSIPSSSSSSLPTRPVKRKKSPSSISLPRHSDQPENRNAEMNAPRVQSPPHLPSSRVFSAMSRPPVLESDLRPFSSQKKGKGLITRHPYYHQHESRLSRAQYEEDEEPSYTGPIVTAEYERMRNEVEALKTALYESKKACKKQAKKLEETKSEMNALTLALQEKESEVTKAKSETAKSEELVATIESSVQCQICMELPDKPFALAPCGHILCLHCLQEWFRKAPPTLDDMDIDPDELTDPQYVLMRTKSCPSCRAVVKRRPVPVFMVKAIAAALRNAKPPSSGSFSRPSGEDVVDEGPWKGIFPSSESEEEEDGRDDEDDDSGSESSEVEIVTTHPMWYGRTPPFRRTVFLDSSESEIDLGDEDGFDSDDDAANEIEDNNSDDNPAPLRYVLPRWVPPTVTVGQEDYDISADDPPDTLKLLRRGCTMEMLQNYEISYYHTSGIIIRLRSLNHLYASDDDESDEEDADAESMHRVFLGWGIQLQPFDIDGETFVSDMLEDIKAAPERWQVTPRPGFLGKMDVRKLVPADAVEEYDTTDSELWMDTEDS